MWADESKAHGMIESIAARGIARLRARGAIILIA
jgi:hypothetical protein